MRHSWTWPNADHYACKQRTCARCGTTSSTYGVGSRPVWTYQSVSGAYLGGRTPSCPPVEPTPLFWNVYQGEMRPCSGSGKSGRLVP
jgi:hypothetical protein